MEAERLGGLRISGGCEKTPKNESEAIIRLRKEKAIKFIKKNYDLISYVILAFVVFLAVRIRTLNLPKLRDITTGSWTLGPDLDPFLFLRWAKEIVENGSLVAVDIMRYVPRGFLTNEELILHPYMIAGFHKIASIFGSESVTQSAAIYPAFMFGLAIVAFFLMTRKIFSDSLGARIANVIALIGSFLFATMPPLLSRTIAGIPEKEAGALPFLFLAFYFFLCAWKAEKSVPRYIHALLAVAATSIMGLIWGGYIYIFTSIGLAVLIAFILGKIDKNRFYMYSIWILLSFVVMDISSGRFALKDLALSTTTGSAFIVFFILLFDFVFFETKVNEYIKGWRIISKWPRQLTSLVGALVLGIVVVSVLFGPFFVFDKLDALGGQLVSPITDRFGVTVAENKQPYFVEWANNFGPMFRNVPVSFWLFFVGSVALFYGAVKKLGRNEGASLTVVYIIFISGLIFSRYSQSGRLDGTNGLSLFVYIVAFIAMIVTAGFYYRKHYLLGDLSGFKSIKFSLILAISFFLISLISARSAVRLIMMLVPSASMMMAYLVVIVIRKTVLTREPSWKIIWGIVAAVVVLSTAFSGYAFYVSINAAADNYAPTSYNQQWQKAMSWVRENTSEDSVFGHWWDYGYWVQSIGERATVLDGGNAIGYWNHLMARHALTGADNYAALEFLYSHNTTHFLIDSTDIGKYGAFSSIGGDANNDRASWIPTFVKDPQSTQERKNSAIQIYAGGALLDEDIVYDNNGSRIFLPGRSAGIVAILVEKDNSGKVVSQPQGVFAYQNNQYILPLRYAFDGELMDFGSGIESGVFIFPGIEQSAEGPKIDFDGALLYLSNRTVKSQLARLYLYGEENPNFRLAHSEEDFLVSQIKSQFPQIGDFVYYGGSFRGPIKIWEIEYPEDIQVVEDYLEITYPDIRLK